MSFFSVFVNGWYCKGHFQPMGKETCGKVPCSDYTVYFGTVCQQISQ
jgi:hypothetical protein